jgi:hypothetical protein
MNTDDLIRAVVADNDSVRAPIRRTMAWALAAGCLMAAVAFALTLGVRSDFGWSIVNSPRFQFKFVFTLAIVIPAVLLASRLLRPDGHPRGLLWLFMVPLLLLGVGAVQELMTVPADHWAMYAVGQNAFWCSVMIPLLSAAPLAGSLYALRQGATSRPALAGAAAGLLASGIAATLYASHCVDDSPLFIALWYSLGIGTVTGIGALLGARLLKW